MIISECKNCGKTMVVINYDAQCCFCGSAKGFETITDVFAPYYEFRAGLLEIEQKMEACKYEEVLAGLDDVIAKGGKPLSGLFWLRLLATHQCSEEYQLLCTGFDPHENSDYINAVKYSEGAERAAYVAVAEILDSMQGELIRRIMTHNNSARTEAGAFLSYEELRSEMEIRKSNLTSLLKQLSEIELQMKAAEMDFQLASEPFISILRKAKESAEALVREVTPIDQCTESVRQGYKLRNTSLETMSRNASAELAFLRKEHTSVKTFRSLQSARDEKVAAVNRELSALQIVRSKASSSLEKLISIDREHRNIIRCVEKYDFSSADKLFPSSMFPELIQLAVSSVSVAKSTVSDDLAVRIINPCADSDNHKDVKVSLEKDSSKKLN